MSVVSASQPSAFLTHFAPPPGPSIESVAPQVGAVNSRTAAAISTAAAVPAIAAVPAGTAVHTSLDPNNEPLPQDDFDYEYENRMLAELGAAVPPGDNFAHSSHRFLLC